MGILQLNSTLNAVQNEMNYSNSKLTEEQKKALFIPDQPGQLLIKRLSSLLTQCMEINESINESFNESISRGSFYIF